MSECVCVCMLMWVRSVMKTDRWRQFPSNPLGFEGNFKSHILLSWSNLSLLSRAALDTHVHPQTQKKREQVPKHSFMVVNNNGFSGNASVPAALWECVCMCVWETHAHTDNSSVVQTMNTPEKCIKTIGYFRNPGSLGNMSKYLAMGCNTWDLRSI